MAKNVKLRSQSKNRRKRAAFEPSSRAYCPRCKVNRLHAEQVINSLSRRDNKTYICNDCGDEEALIVLGMEQTDMDGEFIDKVRAVVEKVRHGQNKKDSEKTTAAQN